MKLMLKLRALGALLAVTAACATGKPAYTAGTTQAPKARSRGVNLVDERGGTSAECGDRLCVYLRMETSAGAAVKQGETLRSGDRFAFYLRVTRPSYVYVVLVDAGGQPSVVFPRQGALLVSGRGEERIPPAGQAFQLDDNVGTENVYVVASARPLEQADREVAEHIGAVRAPAPAEPPPASLPSRGVAVEPEPKASPKPKKRKRRRKRIALLLKGRIRGERDKGFGVVTVNGREAARANNGGVAFFHFHFRHVGR